MPRFNISRKHLLIGSLLMGLLLVAFLVYRLIPLTLEDMEDSSVVIEQESYYQLEINGKPSLYFANYEGSLLIGGTVNKDSIKTRKVRMKGYWVNRYPVVPSCFGRIVTKWENRPSRIVNLSSDAIHQFLLHEYFATDDELAGLQTQHNELSYYMRMHSVKDFGYNRIADYHKYVTHQMDSLNKVIAAIRNIKSDSHLRIRQINRYVVLGNANAKRKECRRLQIYADKGDILIQTVNKLTPINVRTRMDAGLAQTMLMKETSLAKKALNKPLQIGTPDSLGYYIGEEKNGIPNGYGRHYGNNGSFYYGHWENGKRNGFGFYIAPHEYLMVGEWKNDVFKGERLTYNNERIYGIDISRHQHEKGNKKFKIDWSKLRIIDLGKISEKKLEGEVNYPISFMYIKSTEGCTVFNNYYNEDYAQASKHGIKVGTYHFFSTTSSGVAQAQYFLSKSKFRKGNLPAVLDVEPSDAQIMRMGGPEAMFKHIRDWMSIVHKRTGVRPILYISQMFTKKYLPLAADIQGNYFVWIARYGEYKPEIKLSIWQLSPDGRVSGIHGDVDINVFNGYKNNYEDFLKKYCIR